MAIDNFKQVERPVLTFLEGHTKTLSSSVKMNFSDSDTWDKDEEREMVNFWAIAFVDSNSRRECWVVLPSAWLKPAREPSQAKIEPSQAI